MLGRRFQRDHVSHGRMGGGRVLAVVQILKAVPETVVQIVEHGGRRVGGIEASTRLLRCGMMK